LEITDLECCHKWHNDPDLYKSLGTNFHYVSYKAEQAWLEEKTGRRQDEVNVAICSAESNKHIGNIYLRDINWPARRAEVHLFIGDPANRSQGYGQSAVRQIVEYAFDRLGLHRLFAFVLEDNSVSRHIFEKCGFETEGLMRQHAFKLGEFKNMVMMGLCRPRTDT
jgi:RimJ/RimL family protein N-acetyltransferase